MKIFLMHPMRNDATNFYRGIGPISQICRTNPSFEVFDATLNNIEFSWATLAPYDVVFIQRPVLQAHLEFVQIAKNCGKPVIVDYDDDVFNIPEHNPRYEQYKNLGVYTEEIIKAADVVIVSTQAIRDSFSDRLGTGIQSKMFVIPNAYNDIMMGRLKTRNQDDQQKVIFWRGGDTHKKDLEPYIDEILAVIHKYPDYKWAFFGYNPRWLTEHPIDPERLLLFPYQDIFTYFRTLMDLSPQIMIVPLYDEKFTRARSNISWIEGTMAGAAVLGPKIPEFERDGICQYESSKDFRHRLEQLIEDSELRQSYYSESLASVPKLSEVNEIRRDTLAMAMDFSALQVLKRPFTDEEDMRWHLCNNRTQENAEWAEKQHKFADWIIGTFQPKSFVDFGCGTGAIIERMLTKNVVGFGLEKNGLKIDYFLSRNPVLSEFIKQVDFQDPEAFALEGKFSVGIAMECFEQIDQPEEWWNDFIKKLSDVFSNFILVFNPQRDINDVALGRVNVRTHAAWASLFERNGWDLTSLSSGIFGKFEMVFVCDLTTRIPFKKFDASKVKINEK